MSTSFLPYGRQVIEDDDIAEVVRVLRGDMLTTGPEVGLFEAAFANAVGARHAIACNSGTSALHLAVMAAGIGPGDKVVVPSITFLATANAVRLTGADVVFADVDRDTGLMTRETLEAAFERAQAPVKAVLPVHLGGQTADIEQLASLARSRGAEIIEDACHALGTSHGVEGAVSRVGSCTLSKAATFSLHPVKTIAAGEGGVITTNDNDLAEAMRRARNHGMTRDAACFTDASLAFDVDGSPNPWYYEMPEIGLNYRLNDFQAALARSQLAKLARFADVRRRIATHYDQLLAPLGSLVRPVPRVPACRPVWHLYQVLIDYTGVGLSRRQVMDRLKALGIGTQVHYIPVHRQPYYARRSAGLTLPGAEAFYSRTLSLPLFASMNEDDADWVVAGLRKILGHA